VFWRASLHNAGLLVLSLAVQLPLAAFLAILLQYPTRCRGLFRTLFFAPMIMPSVAIAVLWTYIYLPEQGILDRIIGLVRPGFAMGWLSDPATVMFCVFVTVCWRYTGFHMVLFMAGLSGIPEELYEAARLDGAGEVAVTRHITLPLLRPVLGVSATLSVIGSLKYFGSSSPRTCTDLPLPAARAVTAMPRPRPWSCSRQPWEWWRS
jgi:raffinose/stachyose/melibiose transport system permease protein